MGGSDARRQQHFPIWVGLVAAATLLALIAAFGATPVALVTCGQEITRDTTLTNDLVDCAGAGVSHRRLSIVVNRGSGVGARDLGPIAIEDSQTANVADDDGDSGIAFRKVGLIGPVDGGRNAAKHLGNPEQCFNSRRRARVPPPVGSCLAD